MNAIPFLYFSFISFYLYKKRKGLDIAVIISMMYAVSGFFSILIDVFDLRYRDSVGYQISAEAAMAYCGLLTLCLLPFALNSHLSIRQIRPLRREGMLNSLAWITFIWFVLTAILSWRNMMNVLTGDMEEYRHMMYEGEGQASWMLALPSGVRFVVAVVNSIFGCPWTLMFLAFYSSFVQKLPRKNFILFMVASLSGPMNGIIGADRSATAYWIMSLFAMFLFFRPLINRKQRKQLYVFAGIVVGALVAYLAAMTIARFGERYYGSDISGTQGGLVVYFGQSYINFCLYFDNYEPPFPHLGIIFPFTYQYILGIPSGGVVIQQMMTDMTGYETGVFYTFMGQIIVAAGKMAAIIFCIVYSLVSLITTSRITHRRFVGAEHLYLYFALASVMYLGIFGHYYTSGTKTFGLIVMFLLLKLMK